MTLQAPLIGIERHRIGSDGDGVTTLVGFAGCTLRCQYCLNPRCFAEGKEAVMMTAQELEREVRIDDLYFRETGGGVVFGGGEPLLRAEFIRRFRDVCSPRWKIGVETALNVPPENLEMCADAIDWLMIDCKDMNDEIYQRYTSERSNRQMKENLYWVLNHFDADHVTVRVPLIEAYNTNEDVAKSISELHEIGVRHIDQFAYILPADTEQLRRPTVERGKSICKYLKDLRLKVARSSGLLYKPTPCDYDGPCRGTCPKCDAELKAITEYINIIEDNDYQTNE